MVRHAVWLTWLLVPCFATAIASAQPPSQPARQQPPLLYVKLIGPRGTRATFFRGAAAGQSFELPCTIGVRPGYTVRLALTGVPAFPKRAFFPTLDVYGSLLMAGNQHGAAFPAAIVFHEDDFARVHSDVTLKRIVVLERPDTAIPVATKPDQPFEISVPAQQAPLREARERGQPLVVVQMGERQFTLAELANVPGTVLLPGDRLLSTPPVSPWLTWGCFPVIDPRGGSISPAEFMCIPDGGDVGLPAGFDRQGKLRGLDPSDTVAEYSDSQGRQRLAVSNRVCLCVPRFIVIKTEIGLAKEVALMGPESARSASGFARTQSAWPTLENVQRARIEDLHANLKAAGAQQAIGAAVTGRLNNIEVTSTAREVESFDAACRPATPPAKDGPLFIIKWPDMQCALIGEIVTFTLRYTNTGGRPISNIVVSDSLTTRFEYVPGSAKTDREAIFTTQPNDTGSQILRWAVSGSLQPKESGVVSFQVRVR